MKTRASHVDTLFHFDHPARLGRCRIRIHRLGPDRPTVVVCTELPGDGPSITNQAEAIASTVTRDHGVDPDCLLWVEHLMPGSFGPEQFAAVSFEVERGGQLSRPSWRLIAREAVERLTGVSLREGGGPC